MAHHSFRSGFDIGSRVKRWLENYLKNKFLQEVIGNHCSIHRKIIRVASSNLKYCSSIHYSNEGISAAGHPQSRFGRHGRYTRELNSTSVMLCATQMVMLTMTSQLQPFQTLPNKLRKTDCFQIVRARIRLGCGCKKVPTVSIYNCLSPFCSFFPFLFLGEEGDFKI